MTRRIDRAVIRRHCEDFLPGPMEDVEFSNCKFEALAVGFRKKGGVDGARISRVLVRDSSFQKCMAAPTFFDDVTVSNVSGDLVQLWAPIFRHCTIEGRFDRLMIHGIPDPSAD